MRIAKLIGSSVVGFYLFVCLASVFVIDAKPAVADSNSVVVEQVIKAKAEPVSEQSVVDKAADAIPDWLEILSTLIGVASAIAAVTPTPKDNVVLKVLRGVLDVFALNVAGAKNAAAEKAKQKSNRLL